MLRKKDLYFSTFPEMKIFGEVKTRLARVIPKSLLEVKQKLEKILENNPILAADMWIIMSIGLRRTDF